MVLKVTNSKIVVLFGDAVVWLLMIWASAVVFFIFFVRDKAFTTRAIPAFIFSFINISAQRREFISLTSIAMCLFLSRLLFSNLRAKTVNATESPPIALKADALGRFLATSVDIL